MPGSIAYDIIGDIHGHADKLTVLLASLGYVERLGVWTPPSGRKAVFVGDLIDRGLSQLAVLGIVRAMLEHGVAHVVMGNHEFNAIGWATPRADGRGEFLRLHDDSKRNQHRAFLAQVGEGSDRHREWVNWFRTLPVALDLGGVRVVHACWHLASLDFVNARLAGKALDDAFLHEAFTPGTRAWRAMERLVKGPEARLPDGFSFRDKDGKARRDVRIKWWLDQREASFAEAALLGDHAPGASLPVQAVPGDFIDAPANGAPVFVGHYWMTGSPVRLSRKVACVDWSAGNGGPLVAYRWDGEYEIDERNFISAV